MNARAAMALTGAALFWSGNFVASRALRQQIDPVMLSLLRWGIAFVVFAPFVGAKAWRYRAEIAREWPWLVALGATGLASFHTLVNLALQTTTALNALLLLSLTPAAIVATSAAIGASRPTRTQWLGTAVSLAGACVLVSHGRVDMLLNLDFTRGDLWMVAAVLLWTAYSLLLRKRPAQLPAGVALAASIVPALALLLPAAALTGELRLPPPSLFVVGAVLYIAVFASLVAFSLWSYGVDAIGPERAGPYVHLMPLFGAVLSAMLLGEDIVPAQVAGAAVVFTGILLMQKGRRRAAPSGCEGSGRPAGSPAGRQ